MSEVRPWDPDYDPNDPPIPVYQPPEDPDPDPYYPDEQWPPKVIIPTEQTFPNNVTMQIPGGEVFLSGNPIRVILTAGVLLTHHKLCLKIRCSSIMGLEAVEKIAPGINRQAVFDISGLLDQPVNYSFDYPATASYKSWENYLFDVTLDIGEEYVDVKGNRVVRWMNLTTGNTLRVSKGKLEAYDLALLNDSSESFYSHFVQGGRFLTNLSDNQLVWAYQEFKLWFISPFTTSQSVFMYMQVYHTYGPAIILNIPITMPGSALMEFTVNPYFMGYIPNMQSIGMNSFTFTLRNSSGVDISEKRTFKLDNRYFEKHFILYYTNPLSGVDCIRLTGAYRQSLTTEMDNTYRPMPQGAGSRTASLTSVFNRRQRSWEINTGIKTPEEMVTIKDLLNARECWLVDPDRVWPDRKLIPVYLEAGDYTLYDSLEYVQHLDLKIFEAHF